MTFTLYHGDCLEEMARIDAGSVDAIIADLPYGTTACKWDSVIPLEPLWAHFKRVLKERGAVVLFGAQPFTTALIGSNLEWFKYAWVWDKKLVGNPFLAKYQPLRTTEDICVFACNGHTYNPIMRKGQMRQKGGGYSKLWDVEHSTSHNDDYYPKDILEVSNAQREGKVHPTQKPVALLEYLVRTYTNEGETVLDCTMGSGTCGVACENTGRNFNGIELEREYYDIAAQRIEKAANAARQLELL